MTPQPATLPAPAPARGSLPPPPGGRDGGDDGGRGGGGRRYTTDQLCVLGAWVALGPLTMMFMSFVSAYIVRRGLGSGWNVVELPRLIWANTAVLLASSLVLEIGRRVRRRGGNGRGWFLATFALGLLFMTGQAVVWRQLVNAGAGISSDSAYSAFFFLLSGAHAVHLLLGLLFTLATAFWPASRLLGMSPFTAARVTSIYWHFMGVLWVGLFLLILLRS